MSFSARRTPPPTSLLPPDILQRLRIYLEHWDDPQGSPLEPTDLQELIYGPLYPLASADPTRFCAELAAATLPDGVAARAGELLVADLRWKLVYDEASPMHFAVLGSRSPLGLAGYLMASQDSSGRRFPFVTGGSFETPQPLEFIARKTLALLQHGKRGKLGPVAGKVRAANRHVSGSLKGDHASTLYPRGPLRVTTQLYACAGALTSVPTPVADRVFQKSRMTKTYVILFIKQFHHIDTYLRLVYI